MNSTQSDLERASPRCLLSKGKNEFDLGKFEFEEQEPNEGNEESSDLKDSDSEDEAILENPPVVTDYNPKASIVEEETIEVRVARIKARVAEIVAERDALFSQPSNIAQAYKPPSIAGDSESEDSGTEETEIMTPLESEVSFSDGHELNESMLLLSAKMQLNTQLLAFENPGFEISLKFSSPSAT